MEPALYRGLFAWACLAFGMAAAASVCTNRRWPVWLAGAGAVLAGVSCVLRLLAWVPFLSLHQAPYFTVLFFAVLCLLRVQESQAERTIFLWALFCLSLIALFFPKDHYLPFLRTRTLFAHVFMISGAAAKACLFAAACAALDWLLRREDRPARSAGRAWIVCGFACLTLSMFSGEAWSHQGWGVPIVWEDPAVIAGMVVWFYYALHLHLGLFRFFNARRTAMSALAGAAVTFVFAWSPDMGRFCWPL